MSNLKDLKNQNLVIDFPIGGKKVDPKTGKLLGYFADVQRAQIPANNTRRGVIYQNPHVCNRKVDYYGKSINNHRMFVDVETVHRMMQAAQKNNEIVYHFKSGDKDVTAHTPHTGNDLAYPNEKTTSEMSPKDLTKTTIAVQGDLKRDVSGLNTRLVIDPNSNFRLAKGVNIRLQDDLTPTKLYDELNDQYHQGNLVLERSTADRLFTPLAKSVGKDFDSRGGYFDRLNNYRTTLNISNRLSQAMRSAHKNGFNLKYTYGVGRERNDLINLKGPVNAPKLDDFKFDLKLIDKNNKTLYDIKNVPEGDALYVIIKMY